MSESPDISVRLLDDARRAQVHIPASTDPSILTPALLLTIATDAKVQATADVQQRVARIVADFKAAPRDLTCDLALATEPVAGTNATWTWEPRFDPAAAPAGVVALGERIDHHASHIITVAPGTPVARTTPPTDGIDGRSVTGSVLPARKGNQASVRPGQGLEVLPDGKVLAQIDGILLVSQGVATVSTLLRVKDSVDFSTGNIDFKGDVHIAHNICDGFKVHALGHLTVDGAIEGAEIVCGAGLTCPGGIASSRRSHITATGNSNIGFLRNTTALFRGSLTCPGELEHCNTSICGECHCEGGRVIGGTLHLTGLAHIGTLGSPAWTPTLVIIGDLPLVATALRRLDANALRLKQAIAAKETTLSQLQSGGGKSASAREQLTELQYELSELRKAALAVDAQRTKQQQAMQEHSAAELHVARIVYPKVTIQTGTIAFQFEKELKGPLQFLTGESGVIQVRICDQEPRPITHFAHAVPPVQSTDSDFKGPSVPVAA